LNCEGVSEKGKKKKVRVTGEDRSEWKRILTEDNKMRREANKK
jgi:hypothetical protein